MKMMILTKRISYLVLFCSIFGCVGKSDHQLNTLSENKQPRENETKLLPTTVSNTTVSDAEIVKLLGEQFKFLGSLEKEVFKIILDDKVFFANQFEVLSYGADQFLNAKSGVLNGYDCQKIDLQILRGSQRTIHFVNNCAKSPRIIAELYFETQNNNTYKIRFISSEWVSLIGYSAQLSSQDRVCTIVGVGKQVDRFFCENTKLTTNSNRADVSLNEINLKKYEYDRHKKNEIEIEGGIYKDLIEIKKISLQVPSAGSVKYSEKKLKIKDDFEKLQKTLLGESRHEENDGQKNDKNNEQKNSQTTKDIENSNGPEEKPNESGEGRSEEPPTYER